MTGAGLGVERAGDRAVYKIVLFQYGRIDLVAAVCFQDAKRRLERSLPEDSVDKTGVSGMLFVF